MIPYNVNYRVIILSDEMWNATFSRLPYHTNMVHSADSTHSLHKQELSDTKNLIERNAASFYPQILLLVFVTTVSTCYPIKLISSDIMKLKNAWIFTSTNPTAWMVWHSDRKVSLFLLLAGSQSSHLSCFFTYSLSQVTAVKYS